MDKAINYQRFVGVSAIAIISTFALLPENNLINYYSSTVPILSGLGFVLLEYTPSAGRLIDGLSRGTAVCWWVWVCYSPMWYHHRYVWWSGAAVFALSFAVCGYNAAMWGVTQDYMPLPPKMAKWETPIYLILVGFTLCFPHHFCVIHMLAKWEVTARTLAFLLCAWFDFIVVLKCVEPPRNVVLWFSNKWWVLYVHTWFLPLVCVMWVVSVANLYATNLEDLEKDSDPGIADVPSAEPADPEDGQRYMFQTPEEEAAGRVTICRPRNGRMVSSWGRPDVSHLVSLGGSVAVIDVAGSNPFDNVSVQ